MHILDYCENIETYLATIAHSKDAFLADSMIQHSVAFCILQIGELVGRLSEALRVATTREINWVAIKGMRNIVAHDYGNVDLDEIWKAAAEDVPILKAFCEARLQLDL